MSKPNKFYHIASWICEWKTTAEMKCISYFDDQQISNIFESECQIFSFLKNEQGTWGLVEKRQIYKLAFRVNSKPVKFASNSMLGKPPASTRAQSCQASHELAWQGPRLLWQNPFSHNLDLTKAREKEIDIKCWASATRAQERNLAVNRQC